MVVDDRKPFAAEHECGRQRVPGAVEGVGISNARRREDCRRQRHETVRSDPVRVEQVGVADVATRDATRGAVGRSHVEEAVFGASRRRDSIY